MRQSFKIDAQILVESDSRVDSKQLIDLIRSAFESDNGFNGHWVFIRHESFIENSLEKTEELFP